MAIFAGKGPLVTGMIMAVPVLLIGAPLVVADVYLRKPEPTLDDCRSVLAKAAKRPIVLIKPVQVAARPMSKPAPVPAPVPAAHSPITLFSPAQIAASLAPAPKAPAKPVLTATIVGAPKRVAVTPPPPARPIRVAALGRSVPMPRDVAPFSCAGPFGQAIACGSAMAQKPGIQAQLSYNRLNTRCEGLVNAYARGGLEGALIYALTASQQSAQKSGASKDAEQAQVNRALQKALAVTGSAPKDVLAALTDLEAVYGGCNGYDIARNALRSTASLIQGELNVDQPTATPGYGAAIANPGLPTAGSLGTSSYTSHP